MGNILLVLLALTGLALPGFTLWYARLDREHAWENLAQGICFGLAIAVAGVYLIAFISLKAAVMTWAFLLLGSLAYWILRKVEVRNVFAAKADDNTRWLLILLLVTAALRFFPTFFEPYPRGWDPYAHLLLVQEMNIKDGHVFDWAPYETIPLRYPTGSHLLVALITKVTGVKPHIVFNLTLVWMGLLTCLQVYALTSQATKNRELALYSAAAYSLLAIAGSAGYYSWGGLPNLLGFYLLLGAVGLFISVEMSNKTSAVLLLFFCSICLVHEHALLVAIAVFGGFGLRSLILRDKPRIIGLLKAAIPSMLLGGMYHYLHDPKGYSLSETGFLRYREELFTPSYLLNSVGAVFVVFVLLGVWVYQRQQRRFALDPFLLWMTVTLLGCFVVFEYGARLVTPLIYGESFAPATPARFLTDAVIPLSAFGGIFFLALKGILGCDRRTVIIGIAVFAGFNHWLYGTFLQPEIRSSAVAAYNWVKTNTPPDTMVLADKVEAAYFCHRPASNAALPSSELWAHTANRNLLYDLGVEILSGKVPDEAVNFPLVLVIEAGMGKVVFNRLEAVKPGFLQPVWQSTDESYYVFIVNMKREAKK